MRTIKFRAKSKSTKQWVYGYVREIWASKQEDCRYIICPSMSFEENGWTDLEETEVIPETIGQFWERSMKEFYGGDLFKAMSSVSGSKKKKIHLCKVVDSESGMDVVVWHEGEWWGYSYMNFCDIERVGNIFDNADLVF